jgi:hypothetical protein
MDVCLFCRAYGGDRSIHTNAYLNSKPFESITYNEDLNINEEMPDDDE